MPNWCNNVLVVKSKTEKELQDFKEKYRNVEEEDIWIDFNSLISKQDTIKQAQKEWDKLDITEKNNRWKFDFEHFWYNYIGHKWQNANWGTKWQAIITEPEQRNKNELIYVFDTAWSPCIPIIEKIINDNPHLDFLYKYEERGMCFAGKIESKNGEIITEYEYDIDTCSCPECECTNIKKTTNKLYECSDCGHKYEHYEEDE